MSVSEKLSKDQGGLLSAAETTRYRCIIGALQYMIITRPDISFSANRVCQYLQAPTDEHWEAVKRILRYLKFTHGVGLAIKKSFSVLLSAFSDADWAMNPDDHRST